MLSGLTGASGPPSSSNLEINVVDGALLTSGDWSLEAGALVVGTARRLAALEVPQPHAPLGIPFRFF